MLVKACPSEIKGQDKPADDGVLARQFEAVFISDLHLHPNEPLITARFNQFVDWAAINTRTVYILGDFFHAWPGDDSLDSWSKSIANRLKWLSQRGVTIYFLHGNRDFLLGKCFALLAGLTILSEPVIIQLNQQKILLVHGDCYCTQDKSHQRFRKLTRNSWFSKVFLLFPLSWRTKMVSRVREFSQANKSKSEQQMEIVLQPMLKHMQQHNVQILIHGHIHKAGLNEHEFNGIIFNQYVLSDWDSAPKILCYDKTKGFKFDRLC